MRNFMPYRGEAELSFEGIHTACISGENGAGKSSVIDAITWALWGKARAKSDDELVHQGENELEVEFEFTVDTTLYRAIRKHAHPKTHRTSGRGSLDLFVQSGASFVAISADTKTQTEQKISQLLHMDYDTFVNSAFLRQGHADEFSRQTPARRKEVLASILSLSQYDEYEARAKDQARAAQDQRLKLEASIGEAAAELEKQAGVKAELVQAETSLQDIGQELTASRKRRDALRTRRQELSVLDTHRRQLEVSLARHETDLASWEASRTESQRKITAYQKLITERENIEAGQARLHSIRKQDEEMSGQVQRLHLLKERRGELERKFLQAQAELNTRHRLAEDRIAKLEEKAGRLPELRRQTIALQPRYQELRDDQFFISNYRAVSQDKLGLATRHAADIKGLKREIEQIQEKMRLLTAPPGGTCCPLCESELGEDRIILVKEKLAHEKAEKETLALGLERSRQELMAQIDQLSRDLDRVETDHKTKNDTLVSDVARLGEATKEATSAETQLASERAELATVAESLTRRDYAAPTLTRLTEVEAAITALDYQEAKHQAVKSELRELEKFENRWRALEEALRSMQEERSRAEQAEKMLADIVGRKTRDRAAREEFLVKLAALPELEQELAQAEAEERGLSARHLASQQTLGSLRERLSYLEGLSDKLKERQRLLALAQHRQEVYDELALAFGKKGIQAMLIETILPEIEDEANRLLAHMTDGRMNVTFETQRGTKKGEVAETLDIKIADELGTRNYELFSGGEAFRIDFAIRIALSRLLARRAGAPLPTLIIDEGFGTQDTDGIDRLKEAINSIQTEFQKIIVITHIEELKSAFPVRINVVKTSDGSKIETSEL